jgi:hypothetical protein
MTIGLAIAAYILFVLWVCQLMHSRDMERLNWELTQSLFEALDRIEKGGGK